MTECDYCSHVEMCGWRKELEDRGCDFFDNGVRWIPTNMKLPEDNRMVVVTWINRNPVPYYEHIKNKPFVGSAHYQRGKWYWYSSVTQDFLDEYGECEAEEINEDIEITAWANIEPYLVKEQGV